MRIAMMLFVLLLVACGSHNRTNTVKPSPPQQMKIRPQQLWAPFKGQQACVEAITKALQREDDIRFGDVIVRDTFGLPEPKRDRSAWRIFITEVKWCKAVVHKGYMVFPDGMLYYVWMPSKPIMTSDAAKKRLVELFRCVETYGNKDPSSICDPFPAGEGGGQ
jgi:hypothetical protein